LGNQYNFISAFCFPLSGSGGHVLPAASESLVGLVLSFPQLCIDSPSIKVFSYRSALPSDAFLFDRLPLIVKKWNRSQQEQAAAP
jgi:putative lipase involved disintegration of autophagic bodies